MTTDSSVLTASVGGRSSTARSGHRATARGRLVDRARAPTGRRLLLAGDTHACDRHARGLARRGVQGAGGQRHLGWRSPDARRLTSPTPRPLGGGRSCRPLTTRRPTTASRYWRRPARSSPTPVSVGSRLPRPWVEPHHPSAAAAVDRPWVGHRYVALLVATHDHARPLAGMHVVVDAANGAASGLAAAPARAARRRVTTIASEPDGRNINPDYGATRSGRSGRPSAGPVPAGLALDGDADRALLVDETGTAPRRRRHPARLGPESSVGTDRSHDGGGRHRDDQPRPRACAPRTDGSTPCAADVGDRCGAGSPCGRSGAALGGEQSGLIMCCHHSVSGDGLLTATQLLAGAPHSDRPVSASPILSASLRCSSRRPR